ncbi:MAG TPA: cytochrome P450 [Caulobacteraceae bacterium]|jgi:hypothetical protein
MSVAELSEPATRAEWITPRHGPAWWGEEEQAWVLTRYADVSALLRAPNYEVSEDIGGHLARVAARAGRDYRQLSNLIGGVLFYRNPPFHPQGRKFLKRCLGVAQEPLRPEAITESARQVVDTALSRGRVDAVREIGTRIPLDALTRGLGLTYEAGETVLSSAHIIEIWRRGMSLRVLDGLQAEARRVDGMLRAEMDAAERTGAGNLAEILAINRAEFGLAEDDVVALLFFLLLAGVETTSMLVSSAIFLLLANPGQGARFEADPGLINGVVDEALRYTPPVRRANHRVIAEPVEIGGRAFAAGDQVIGHIEQAHFDPAAYPDPVHFDIARRGPPTAAFGFGAHACLGAAIARQEGRAVLGVLFERARLGLVSERPQWQDHPVFRRLERLDVTLEPRDRSR